MENFDNIQNQNSLYPKDLFFDEKTMKFVQKNEKISTFFAQTQDFEPNNAQNLNIPHANLLSNLLQNSKLFETESLLKNLNGNQNLLAQTLTKILSNKKEESKNSSTSNDFFEEL